MTRVVVCGSINNDTTLTVAQLPGFGETVMASEAQEASGGKGANQAYAAARTADGVTVSMLGAVGADEQGRAMRAELEAAGVHTSDMMTSAAPTGHAVITVSADGENTIVVNPGANHAWPLSPSDATDIQPGDVLLIQLELPLHVVDVVMSRAETAAAPIILNASPVIPGAEGLLRRANVLIVNEPEAHALLGVTEVTVDSVDAIRERFTGDLVVTLGGRGAAVVPRGRGLVHVPPIPVTPIDTVGAGDAFAGTLAAAVAGGTSLLEAVLLGNAAGALTTTVHGARHPQLSRAVLLAHTSQPADGPSDHR